MSDAFRTDPVDPTDQDDAGSPAPDEEAVRRPAAGGRVLRFPARHDADTIGETPEHSERPLRDVIGGVLRDERLDQDRTLAEVAREAAVSLPYLSEVERGRKEVSSDLLAAICDALDLSLADVLERSAERLRPTMRGGSGMMLLAA